MQDTYTLVIPTYNRPQSLARLLHFLQAQNVPFLTYVLDSGTPESRVENRAMLKQLAIATEYREFPQETHPFDKFKAGIDAVTTPFCGLCADDDILLPSGLAASVDFLAGHDDYVVAHGYYFQFSHSPQDMVLSAITYYTPSYDQEQPLERLHFLMRHYQALTYGTYKTEALQRIFATVRPVTSLLARELLSSALAAAYGRVARLPVLFHGRNSGPSSPHEHWHPLEWLMSDPDGLLAEYARCRDILAGEIAALPQTPQDPAAVKRLVDLIHAQYFVAHAPFKTLDYTIGAMTRGDGPDSIMSTYDFWLPLVAAAENFFLPGQAPFAAPQAPAPAPPQPFMTRLAQKLGLIKPPEPAAPPSSAAPEPQVRQTSKRSYQLLPPFYAPPAQFQVALGPSDHEALINVLDLYE